jgi:hypothetical protein
MDSCKNGLFLAERIEAAYDKLEVCFISMPVHSDWLIFKVLNPVLFKVDIGSTAGTFESWDLKELDTSFGMPSKKILSYHATKAVEWARSNEWISSAEHADLMPRASFDSPPEPPQAAMKN